MACLQDGPQGTWVAQFPCATGPDTTGILDAFQSYVYGQLVSGVPDKLVNCVEDAQRSVGTSVEYIFHRLPERTFLSLCTSAGQAIVSINGPMGAGFAWVPWNSV